MNDPTISCVIPVYNGERYLAEAIDSVLAQTRRADEIIIVDDGSTDGTAEVAARYHDWVRYVYQEQADVAAARNHGVRLSRGRFLAFLDADDLFVHNRLELQMRRFEDGAELDLCGGLAQDFWSPELSKEQADEGAELHQPRAGQIITWLVRHEMFDRVGPFDETLAFASATDWYFRAIDSGAMIENLDRLVAYRRLHDHNKTRLNRDANLEAIMRISKRRIERRQSEST